jgi:peptidoglycan hydrolase CwlO-like protein
MQDGLAEAVARIDERTGHIQGDVKELKATVGKVSETVNKHCADLAAIKTDIENLNHTGLNRKQMVGIGSAGGLIVGAIIAVIDFLMHV